MSGKTAKLIRKYARDRGHNPKDVKSIVSYTKKLYASASWKTKSLMNRSMLDLLRVRKLEKMARGS